MSGESGAVLLLVIVVVPAVVLTVLATLTEPSYAAPGRPVPGDLPVASRSYRWLFPLCRVIGHRVREEAPGIFFCPRCGSALPVASEA